MATDYGWEGLKAPRKNPIEEIKGDFEKQTDDLDDIIQLNRISTALTCITIALATVTLVMTDFDKNKDDIKTTPKIEKKSESAPTPALHKNRTGGYLI